MSDSDTARQTYNAARSEVLLRMRLRDNVLLVFLTVTGAFLGLSLQNPENKDLSLAIPFFSLGAAILVSQHNLLAAAIGQFLAHEVAPFLMDNNEHAPHWDNSVTFKKITATAAWFRFVGHCLIVAVPSSIALIINLEHATKSPFPHGQVWWAGAVCFIGSIGTLWWSHKQRLSLYADREWPSHQGG